MGIGKIREIIGWDRSGKRTSGCSCVSVFNNRDPWDGSLREASES